MVEETYNDSNVRCPYCKKENSDSYELGDGFEGCGITECGVCGNEFQWQREIHIAYKGKPIENTTP